MQRAWKPWLQRGSTRTVSPRANLVRQMAHSDRDDPAISNPAENARHGSACTSAGGSRRGGLQLRQPRASARVLLVLLLLLGVVVVVGSAAARAARDAERALEHDAERERRDEAAREEREGEDRVGVELACRCRDRPSVRNGAG